MLRNNATNLLMMRRYDLLGSMKQSVSPFLMDDKEFTYLKDISFDEVGSISKDGGFSQLGADLDSSGTGDLLHLYMDSTGAFTELAVTNGKLFKYVGGVWTEITHLNQSDSQFVEVADVNAGSGVAGSSSTRGIYVAGEGSIFTAGEKCTAVNRGGRTYITNSLDGLRYTDGTTVTMINDDNGGAEIRGKYLAVLDDKIFLANISGTHKSSDVVYTMENSDTFYNPNAEGFDTYVTTSQLFSANDAITGMVAFQGNIIFFTESEMNLFNPLTLEVSVIGRIGCSSHESIREINGILYWVNRDGVFRFNGKDTPELISIPITNWATNSLWRLIDGSVWNSIPAVSFEGKYMFYVGNLTGTLPGDESVLSDVVIVYDTYRDVWYFLTNYPVGLWSRYINSDGNLRLLFIGHSTPEVFQKDYSYTTKTGAIEMVVRSKYFNFDMPENEKVLDNLLITCRPSGGDGKYMTVKLAINGSNNYVPYVTSSTSTKVELDAISGTEFQLDRVTVKGVRARTVSYEFSNADSATNMILLGYTQQYRNIGNNMNLSV